MKEKFFQDMSRRKFMSVMGTAGLTAALVPAKAKEKRRKRPKIVFVTGDDEYRSEITMPFIAELLGRKREFKCTVLYTVDPATGKPIVGLRTSTHAFRYPDRHKNRKYNEKVGIEVFGQKWITCYGRT